MGGLLAAKRRLIEEAGAERDGQELKTSQSRSRGSLLSSTGWHGGNTLPTDDVEARRSALTRPYLNAPDRYSV